MLPRLIPVVIVDRGRAIWTRKFREKKYLGDPLNICRLYSDLDVSEIVLFDRSKDYSHSLLFDGTLASICREISVPLTLGGGLTTPDQIERAFAAGVDKIVIKDTNANFDELSSYVVNRYGSQSLTVCFNYSKELIPSWQKLSSDSSDLQQRVEKALEVQPGELLFQNVRKTGSRSGLDTEILEHLGSNTRIPAVISGGASSLIDIQLAVKKGFSGVAVSTLFSVSERTNAPLVSYIGAEDRKRIFV